MCKLQKGDPVQLTSFAEGRWKGGELELLDVPCMITSEEVAVGGSAYVNLSENQNYSWGAVHEYTVIAAYPVAEKLIKDKQSNWLMVGTILYYGFYLQRRKYALLRSVGMAREQAIFRRRHMGHS